MPAYVAFLRAVNVGGRPFPMAHLRELLTAAGYGEVATHIQTGNVRLTTLERSLPRLETILEKLFEEDRGFRVDTIVLTPAQLRQVAADADALADEHGPVQGHYVSLLKRPPSQAGAEALIAAAPPGETVVIRAKAVHLLYDKAYHEARVSNATVERHLGVATNRNAKVIRACAEKWG